MAESKAIQAAKARAARVESALGAFDQCVQAREERAAAGAGTRACHSALNRALSAIQQAGEAWQGLGDPEAFSEACRATQSLQAARDRLALASTSDDSEGEGLASKCQQIASDEFEEEETKSRARDLLTRWSASAPKKVSKGGTSTSGAPRGENTASLFDQHHRQFKVEVRCEKHGPDVVASTGKKNRNSLVNQAVVKANNHHLRQHGVSLHRGDESYTGLAEAIDSVMAEGGPDAAQGGGYKVTRVYLSQHEQKKDAATEAA